ncbi:hypothetical protein BH09BAC2_BH09BAC2_17820 [soil metagenome]
MFSLSSFCNCGISQTLRTPVSASYLGLGAYSTQHVDVFSITGNVASTAQIKAAQAGVYGEKRYLLAATNMYSGIVAVPTHKGNFCFQADYFGYKNYNETQMAFGYARGVGSKVDVGVKFNYYSFKIPVYGGASAFSFEIGAIAHLTEKLHAGIDVYNPVGGKFSKGEDEKLNSVYKFGLGYDASEKFFISCEILKIENQPVNVNAGFMYNFLQHFFVRAGVTTANSIGYAGAGISWKNFRLDVSSSYHPQLGLSPGVLLIVNFKNKKIDDPEIL